MEQLSSSSSSFMEQFRTTLSFLSSVVQNRALLANVSDPDRVELLRLCGAISLPNRDDKKKLTKAFRKEEKVKRSAADKSALAKTGLRESQKHGGITVPFFTKPPALVSDSNAPMIEDVQPEVDVKDVQPEVDVKLHKKRSCYCCGVRFAEVHHFYGSMCRACGDVNFAKRLQTSDLTGRIALCTGGRVKIGFAIVLKLLRANARVIVVTRFARDGVLRFSKEPDFHVWRKNLEIFGVDLRHTPSVESFCSMLLNSLPHLDFIIHNACQTVRRPTAFYRHLWQREQMSLELLRPEEQLALSSCSGVVDPVLLSQVELLQEDQEADSDALFPENVYG